MSNERIDTSKYDGYTKTEWSARNLGDGSPMSCDKDYDHDIPFMETEADDGHNPAIGYMVGGEYSHSLEERRANMRLMADAPEILAELKRCYEREDEAKAIREYILMYIGEMSAEELLEDILTGGYFDEPDVWKASQ